MGEWIDTPESSNLQRFMYNEESQVLTVEFKNGGVYEYYDVPVNIYEGLVNADSKGSYLYHYIKGSFRYSKQ